MGIRRILPENLVVFGICSGFNVIPASHGGTLPLQLSEAVVDGLGLGGEIRFGFFDFFQSHLLAVVGGFKGSTGTGVNVSRLDRLFLITLTHGGTLFRGSNVYFIDHESLMKEGKAAVNTNNNRSTTFTQSDWLILLKQPSAKITGCGKQNEFSAGAQHGRKN